MKYSQLLLTMCGKRLSLLLTAAIAAIGMMAQNTMSPDGNTSCWLGVDKDGRPTYSITHCDDVVIENAQLGLVADYANLSEGLSLMGYETSSVDKHYSLRNAKIKECHFEANRMVAHYRNNEGFGIDIEVLVSNNNVAFRYCIPTSRPETAVRVLKELTEFRLNSDAVSFVCPQAAALEGWERTKPSYETEYVLGNNASIPSEIGLGFTFPCLFRQADKWLLISETGTDSRYCGCRLLDPVVTDKTSYRIGFPQEAENNHSGTIEPTFSLPGCTPWRTITVSEDIKDIAESTIAWDVVEQRYEPSCNYKEGKSTWSWIVWQDESCNYDDQVQYIDLAAEMGFSYTLVDALWDEKIGYEGIERLASYARSKGIDLFLWYNSNGAQNTAPQTPRNKMNTATARKQEMKWLQSIGIKGIKVDFFGGDKQETIQLYEDILADANEYGLMVIFHGCTLPRGWERMYPNFMGSEAVLASENLYFEEHFCIEEAVNACTHPFIRNAVASMEFGGCFLNKYMSRDNKSRHPRHTTDVFQVAIPILFQNSIQNIAITPNNLYDAPKACIDFLKEIPTTWDESRLLDGYPGKNVVMARRHGDTWYVVAMNAETEPYIFDIDLSTLGFASNSTLQMLSGGNDPTWSKPRVKKNHIRININQNDAVVLLLQK